MKTAKIIGLPLILAGLFMVFLPYHVEFTGYVLLLLGAGTLVCALLKEQGKKKLLWLLASAMTLCSVILGAACGYIAWYGSFNAPLPGSDYAVILGAQVHDDVPSRTLRERLDAGLAYMEENPDTVIIVSGGFGTEEKLSEAEVMYRYLESRGADTSRIYREDKATDTRENLIYSSQMAEELGLDKTRVTVITSEFHLCRAEYIASTLGLGAGGVGSKTQTKFLLGNYYIREAFSFVKAYFEGR